MVITLLCLSGNSGLQEIPLSALVSSSGLSNAPLKGTLQRDILLVLERISAALGQKIRVTVERVVMAKLSAGLLVYRWRAARIEVLLAHPGGPFWKNKDEGAWSIVKGEVTGEEDPLGAARREFVEEAGLVVDGPFLPLGSVVQKAGKTVLAWACEANLDTKQVRSNRVTIEFPPRSGRRLEIPEIDRAEYFELGTAKVKINPGQLPLLDRLAELVSGPVGLPSVDPPVSPPKSP